MAVADNNLSVLPFYKGQEYWHSKQWYTYGQVCPVMMKSDTTIPFQFVVSGSLTVSAASIRRVEDDVPVRDLTVSAVQGDGYTVIISSSHSASSLPFGRYYYSVTLSDNSTYMSDIVSVIDDESKYVRIEYWNSENLYYEGGHVEFENGFHFIMYVQSTIGKPDYEFQEEITERLGYKFIDSQISNKVYNFVFPANEALCDAVRLIRMCDYINIKTTLDSYNAIYLSNEVKWEDNGDIAAVTISFETDTIIQKLESINRTQVANFYNALLANIDEPIMFDEDVVAQYYQEFLTTGTVSGKLIRQLNEATEAEVKENDLFLAVDFGSGEAKKVRLSVITKLFGDSFLEEDEEGNIRVKGGKNFYTEGELSAGGFSEEEGGETGGGGGIDENTLWSILAQEGTQQIDKSHITTALTGYATEQWVLNKKYLTEATLTEQLSKYVTLTALSEQLSNYVTSTALSEQLSKYVTLETYNTFKTTVEAHISNNNIHLTAEEKEKLSWFDKDKDGNIYVTNGLNFYTEGELSAGGYEEGEGGGGTGNIFGIKVNGSTYKPVDGYITIPNYPTELSWGAITGKPTTLAGYGITDAFTKNESDGRYVNTAGDTMSGVLTIKHSSYPQLILDTSNSDASSIRFSINGVSKVGVGFVSSLGAILTNYSEAGNSINIRNGYLYWNNAYKFIHEGNYVNTTDIRYVKKSGDTMTGEFINTNNIKVIYKNHGVRLTGDSDYGYLQLGNITSTAEEQRGIIGGYSGAYLDSLDIRVKSSVLSNAVTINNNTVWHAGNDGDGSGLDADLLDGIDSTYFYRDKNASVGVSDNWNTFNYNGAWRTNGNYEGENCPSTTYRYGLLSVFKALTARVQIYFPHSNNYGIQYRVNYDGSDGQWLSWKTIASTDSNVASATKLQTPRTLWGQSFDGTANVSGNIIDTQTVKSKDGFWLDLRGDTGVAFYVSDSSKGGITDTGFGIGTTSPNYTCHVKGTFYASEAAKLDSSVIVPYTGTTWIQMATRIGIIQGNQNQSASSAHALYRVKNSNGDAIVFGGLGVSTGFYGFTASRISSGENGYDWATVWDVGTGNITHDKGLNVKNWLTVGSTAVVTGRLSANGGITCIGEFNGYSGQFRFGSNNPDDATYGKYHRLDLGYHSIDHCDFYEGEFNFYSNGGGTKWAKIGSTNYFSGNVGIKTSSPAYALDVRGDISTNASQYINGIRVYKDTDGYLCIQGNLKITGNVAAAGEVAAGSSLASASSFLYDVTSFDSYSSTSTTQAPTARAVKLIKDKVSEAATNASNAATKANQAASDISLIDMYLTQITSSTTLDQLKTILMNIAKNL